MALQLYIERILKQHSWRSFIRTYCFQIVCSQSSSQCSHLSPPPSQTLYFSLIYLTFWPSYVPSHLLSSWVILILALMTPTAKLSLSSSICYTVSTSHNISTSPLTPALPASQSRCPSQMTWQSRRIWTSLSPSPKKNNKQNNLQKPQIHLPLCSLGLSYHQNVLLPSPVTWHPPLTLWPITNTHSPLVSTSWLPSKPKQSLSDTLTSSHLSILLLLNIHCSLRHHQSHHSSLPPWILPQHHRYRFLLVTFISH